MKPVTAFRKSKLLAQGDLAEVITKIRKPAHDVLIFDDATGHVIDLDWSSDTPKAPAIAEPRKPGRPKLGVVSREVTLLPRHWDWLNLQPGGASVALRKLVEEARKVHRNTDRIRQVRETAYRFISAMAGNEPGFEEATRGLFAGDPIRFAHHSQHWPPDVRAYAAKLASKAFT